MARTWVLQDLAGLPDPLQPYNFDLSIPNVPGGGNGYQLMLRCASATLPGHANEDGILPLRGSEITYAGRPLWEHAFNPTFSEHRDMVSRQSLLNWILYARDNRTSPTAGAYMTNYKTIGDLIIYDDIGKEIRRIRLHGLWCQSLQEAQLESQGSGPVMLGASFRYDWFEDL